MIHVRLERVSVRQLNNPVGFKIIGVKSVLSARYLGENGIGGDYELLCEVEEPIATTRPMGWGQE